MSQKTFKGFPFFSGSIQYSPSSRESLDSRMCLQESPGEEELDPIFSNDRKNKQSFNRLNFSSFFSNKIMNFFFFLPCPIVEKFICCSSREMKPNYSANKSALIFSILDNHCVFMFYSSSGGRAFLSYWTYTFAAVSRVILQFVGSNYDLLLYIRLLVHLCAAFRDSAHHWVHRQLTRIPSKQINLLKLC